VNEAKARLTKAVVSNQWIAIRKWVAEEFCRVANFNRNSLMRSRIFRTLYINILLHQQNWSTDRSLWSSNYPHYNSYLIAPIHRATIPSLFVRFVLIMNGTVLKNFIGLQRDALIWICVLILSYFQQ